MNPERQTSADHILYFDGICGLCNRFVDWLLLRDKKQVYRFATLQGTAAKQHLDSKYITELNTLVIYKQGSIYTKSRAVFEILDDLGGHYKSLARWRRYLPVGFSDFIYDIVAQNRHILFNKKTACRLPTAEERSRFLD